MAYVFLIIMAVLLYISWRTYHDILSPSFIFCIMWLISGAGLLFSGYSFEAFSWAYLIFALGAVLFQAGYMLVYQYGRTSFHPVNAKESEPRTLPRFTVQFGLFKVLLVIETLCVLVFLVMLVIFIKNNFMYNLFTSFYANKSSFGGLLMFGYIKKAINAITVCWICINRCVANNHTRQYKWLLIWQIVLGVICALTEFTRNGILSDLLPLVMAIFVSFPIGQKKVIKYLGWFVLVFGLVFMYVTVSKNWLALENSTFWETLRDQIRLYLVSPLVAYERFLAQGDYQMLFGGNTFRFFMAIFDRIFHTASAAELTQEFINIDGQLTNVYTFYQFYTQDFGPLYGLFIQFLLGMLYAWIYRGVKAGSVFGCYAYALSMYPLVMQFFNDQYLSLLSTWLQYLIIGLVFLKTDLLVKKLPAGTTVNKTSPGIKQENPRKNKNGRGEKQVPSAGRMTARKV